MAALGLPIRRRGALVLGGSDADPCPPNASCPAPDEPPLRDGAIFDPQQERWRKIAPAPVGFSFAEGVEVGATVYVLTYGERGRPEAPRAFLAYSIGEHRWTVLPFPLGDGYKSITATDRQVVAFSGSDEGGEVPDLIFDPATSEWSDLPDDPLPRSFDRTMAWSGNELVLFAHELVPQPGAEEPSVVLAAALDPDDGAWRRLPDSEILGQGARWFEFEGRLILPALGSADGGDVGNWGRPYPYGGILDPERGEWSDLPRLPVDFDLSSGEQFSGGILADLDADYFGLGDWVLDASSDEWIEVPPLDDEEPLVTGRTVVAAGQAMLAFGGFRGELLNDAWIWTPRG